MQLALLTRHILASVPYLVMLRAFVAFQLTLATSSSLGGSWVEAVATSPRSGSAPTNAAYEPQLQKVSSILTQPLRSVSSLSRTGSVQARPRGGGIPLSTEHVPGYSPLRFCQEATPLSSALLSGSKLGNVCNTADFLTVISSKGMPLLNCPAMPSNADGSSEFTPQSPCLGANSNTLSELGHECIMECLPGNDLCFTEEVASCDIPGGSQQCFLNTQTRAGLPDCACNCECKMHTTDIFSEQSSKGKASAPGIQQRQPVDDIVCTHPDFVDMAAKGLDTVCTNAEFVTSLSNAAYGCDLECDVTADECLEIARCVLGRGGDICYFNSPSSMPYCGCNCGCQGT